MKRQVIETRAVAAKDPENRQMDFVLSTSAKDRHGTVLNPNGWRLDNYLRNPIVGYQHMNLGLQESVAPDLVIGKTLDIGVREGVLQAKAEFEPDSINPLAGKIFRKLLFGSLSATSVSFLEIGKGRYADGTYYFDGQELIEWSVVNIPSNPEAVKKMSEAPAALLFALKNLGSSYRPSQIESMKPDQAYILCEARAMGIESKNNDLRQLKNMIEQMDRSLYHQTKKERKSPAELHKGALSDLEIARYLDERSIELGNNEMSDRAWVLRTRAHRTLDMLKKEGLI